MAAGLRFNSETAYRRPEADRLHERFGLTAAIGSSIRRRRGRYRVGREKMKRGGPLRYSQLGLHELKTVPG